MAHLVGDVVDGEEVAGRSRKTGATAGLVRAADHAELRNSAAGLSEPTVAEVVVARADDLADDDAVTPEVRAPEALAMVKQPAAPQGPFGATAWAYVLRLRRSLFAISCSRIVRSSS